MNGTKRDKKCHQPDANYQFLHSLTLAIPFEASSLIEILDKWITFSNIIPVAHHGYFLLKVTSKAVVFSTSSAVDVMFVTYDIGANMSEL